MNYVMNESLKDKNLCLCYYLVIIGDSSNIDLSQ